MMPEPNYTLLTYRLLPDLMDEINQSGRLVVVDTETSGLSSFRRGARVVAISMAANPEHSWLIKPDWFYLVAEVLAKPDMKIIGQNFRFDAHQLRNHKIVMDVANRHDTILLAYCLRESKGGKKLEQLAKQYLDWDNWKKPLQDWLDQHPEADVENCGYANVPAEILEPYAGHDARATAALWDVLYPMVQQQGLEGLYDWLRRIDRVVERMETAGIHVDKTELMSAHDDLQVLYEDRLAETRKIIFKNVGREEWGGVKFDPKNDVHVAALLFDEMGLAAPKGSRDINNILLEGHAKEFPVVRGVLDCRNIRDALDRYILPCFDMTITKDCRIHPSYLVFATVTGRVPASNPAITAWPSLSHPYGPACRRPFMSRWREGRILECDQRAADLRVLASLSGDDTMIKLLSRADADFHLETAKMLFSTTEVTPTQRFAAKTCGLGIIYGMTPWGLAKRLDCSEQEAQALLAGFFKVYPGVRQYLADQAEVIKRDKQVVSPYGRVRRPFDGEVVKKMDAAIRQGINAPIQGSSSDLNFEVVETVLGWLKHWEWEAKAVPIAMIYDSIYWDCESEFIAQQVARLTKLADPAVRELQTWMRVPLLYSYKIGTSWSTLEPYEVPPEQPAQERQSDEPATN